MGILLMILQDSQWVHYQVYGSHIGHSNEARKKNAADTLIVNTTEDFIKSSIPG